MTNTKYIIHSEQFEGPLDVLLHLVQKSKVDLMDISIADITDQYITYIKSLQELNLEVASEYLLMSARLIEMKSRMLLPRLVDENGEEEIDPREELIQRLLEYKKYKDVTQVFKEFELDRQQVYSKPMSNINEWVQNETVLNTENKRDIYQLVNVFERMLERQRHSKQQNVTMERQGITIEEQVDYITTTIKQKKKVSLMQMLENQTREYIVTTFLAVLQLIRIQEIGVVQEHNFDDIELTTIL